VTGSPLIFLSAPLHRTSLPNDYLLNAIERLIDWFFEYASTLETTESLESYSDDPDSAL